MLQAFLRTDRSVCQYLLPVSLAHTVLRALYFLLGGSKDKFENNLWLTDGDVLKVSFNIVAYFNLFMLLCALFKFLKEKMKILHIHMIRKIEL